MTTILSAKTLLSKYFYMHHITHQDAFIVVQKPDAESLKALGSLTHPTSKELFSAASCGMNKVKNKQNKQQSMWPAYNKTPGARETGWG